MATKAKLTNTTNNVLTLVLLTIASFLLLLGLGAVSYFLITQSFQITTLTDKKANQSDVYDRKTIDNKIPSVGIPGLPGPKGDPGQVGITLLMTKDYSFASFADLKDEAPIVIFFSTTFEPKEYVNMVFVGWIVTSRQKEKLLSGEIYDLNTKQTMGYYNLTSKLDTTVGTTDKIKWIFQKMFNLELLENYNDKAELVRELATKILKSNAYTKEDVDRLVDQKASLSEIYYRTVLEAKLKNLPGLKDHYSKTQLDSKLTTKIDKATSYTKVVIDAELTTKEDKTAVYDKTDFDNLLATKYDKNLLYPKTTADNKLKPAFFNTFTSVKTGTNSAGRITSKNYSSFLQNYLLHARFQKATDELQIDNLKLYKGDRLVVEGKIAKTHNNHQGPVFLLTDSTGKQVSLASIKHWNRWIVGTSISMEQTSASGNLAIADYPLFIAHNLIFDYYQFKIEIFFGDDYIYVKGHGFLNNQSNINDTYSMAILNYPPGFAVNSSLTLGFIRNHQVDYSTAKKTQPSKFGNGSEIKITFDLLAEQHAGRTTPTKQVVVPFA